MGREVHHICTYMNTLLTCTWVGVSCLLPLPFSAACSSGLFHSVVGYVCLP